jgi:hypothetical protein
VTSTVVSSAVLIGAIAHDRSLPRSYGEPLPDFCMHAPISCPI